MVWALCGAAAAVYWALSLQDGHSTFRSMVKGLAVAPLAIWALGQGAPVVALALALCSAGDVFLSRPGERAFLAGLIAFAMGHVVWIAAFAGQAGLDTSLFTRADRGLAVLAITLLAVFMLKTLLPRAGDLRIPVAIYIAIIITMGLAALATPLPLLIAGAALFMASDTLLGLQTFVLAAGETRERIANTLIWPLYWGAIALMTLATL